jgi:hypothetical protein
MQDNRQFTNNNLFAIIVAGIVAYILISAVLAVPMKYIFFDYFARIGWPTDFSYMTTIMIILGLRLLYSAAIWAPKTSVQSSKNK